ncbi:exonuclease domain-containing protein, partial [Herminiimonas sp. CN]|uniref:exonuclease domain-containing protein n=1 Tax=Herminiimonas sp. CN TaxID=1349818 RepID=UPI000473A203
KRLDLPDFDSYAEKITDTLAQAKELHPGKRNSLDSLCDRYGISNAHRTLHGALLDAELLAEVYLAMTRGQNSLTIDLEAPESELASGIVAELPPLADVMCMCASAEELAEHDAILADLDKQTKGDCVWINEGAA